MAVVKPLLNVKLCKKNGIRESLRPASTVTAKLLSERSNQPTEQQSKF
jgi:hypothetical protein